MPRTKPADERRADLLAAGQALFVARGVAATTLEDITTGAGVSKGLFYQYFHSKEDLVFALQEQFANQFAERVRAATQTRSDWSAKLDACVEACFASFQAEHQLHEVLFRHVGHPAESPGHPAAHHALVETIRSLLTDGVAAGVVHADDPATTALLLVCAMHAFDPTFRGPDDVSDSRLVHATQHLVRRAAGILEPPPTPRARRTRPDARGRASSR